MSTTIPFVRLDSHVGTTINFLTPSGPVTVRETHPYSTDILNEMAQTVSDDNTALIFADNDEAGAFLDMCRSNVRTAKTRQVVELTGLLTYDGEDIMFYNNTVINPVADHITELYDAGNEDWKPLARFLERLQHNPDQNSRMQLYTWMNEHGLVVTSDGRFIAYKGLTDDDTSTYDGGAYINGLWVDGVVKNTAGDVISLERAHVINDPDIHCSYGLHVGSFTFAQGYGGARIATVIVDPRHVVSVPNDAACAKVRVCEYTVVTVDDKPDCLYRGRYGVLDLDLPDKDDLEGEDGFDTETKSEDDAEAENDDDDNIDWSDPDQLSFNF